MPAERDVIIRNSRDSILGEPTYTKSSDLGVTQFRHPYPRDLVEEICRKAIKLRHTHAEKRHLNLMYIRGAQRYIPEIAELVHFDGRLEMLSDFAGTNLEVYPLSVISTIITFQDCNSDGSIVWHCDGIPITEMVPLSIDRLVGGDLQLYCGNPEVGMARVYNQGETILDSEILSIRHRLNYSILGQLMRLMHRVEPISQGCRITLNMNLRSESKPYIDDNNLCYLAADNPDLEWKDEYVADVVARQLPSYVRPD
ncbi:hypothetical protein [Pelagibius sp. Alg239-R121]|uniref:hypothetical protein n=1 Tax=Pelagibius sp. Alg239-R121 TaxID=2993448 RepID=UPI0024A7A21B|nr:hypothetical protein [Pelagibius sp. Alg239-R121]